MTAAADFKTACRDVAVTDEAAVDPLMRNLGNEFIMMIMIGLYASISFCKCRFIGFGFGFVGISWLSYVSGIRAVTLSFCGSFQRDLWK